MKKLVILTLMALSFLAARPVSPDKEILPTCDPCPWVR